MQHETFDFAIDYLGADGQKRGQEICTLTVHRSGHRTLRARSEIFDSEVLRDVVYTVSADFRPLDALIRVSVRDAFVGTALFVFRDDVAECESDTASDGRLSQRLEFAARPISFITHAVSADVWHGASITKQPGLGAQPLQSILSSSPLHNGSSGPSLGRWPLQAHFVGVEQLTTPAGSFAAERIRYEEPTGELFLDTWCTADANRIMLQMYYPPYNSSYVLTTLSRRRC